ncbi:hypothetical protein THOM_1953 [Trachipleistophora hominis]|uniref:Uncharacterized protein n=1 Tax=Trachipleistophora hominis TaxID=72359 RepID=L7JUL6_TRAHO|nr:hypothetical protein THOM_1953 [Trachipleistophora hominis]
MKCLNSFKNLRDMLHSHLALLFALSHFSIYHYIDTCNATPVSRRVTNTRRVVSSALIRLRGYYSSDKQCTCNKCCGSFMINVCQLTTNTVNMIKSIIADNISLKMRDNLCSADVLCLIDSIKKQTRQHHLFCYNLIRNIFRSAELLHRCAMIIKQPFDEREKRSLKKVLTVLRKDCFFSYENSHIFAIFEFDNTNKASLQCGIRADFFNCVRIPDRVLHMYISMFSESEYFDIFSLFGIIPRYIQLFNWSPEHIETFSCFCNDQSIILWISNMFLDISRISGYISMEFLTWKHLIAIEFQNVSFRSDNIFLGLRPFVHLEMVCFHKCCFVERLLFCNAENMLCKNITDFKNNVNDLGESKTLSLGLTAQMIENYSVQELHLEIWWKFDFQLFKMFKNLKFLGIGLKKRIVSARSTSGFFEDEHPTIIQCVASMPTLRKLLVRGLMMTAKASKALSKLQFVEEIRLYNIIFFEPFDSYEDINLWTNKLQVLSFPLRNYAEICVLIQNIELPNLEEIIIWKSSNDIRIPPIIMNVVIPNISKLTLFGFNDRMITSLIEILPGLTTLQVENSLNSFMIALFTADVIKHRVKKLIIVSSYVEDAVLEAVAAFTRLNYLQLNLEKSETNLNPKIFAKFKRKITLKIISPKLTLKDFYTMKKYKAIKDLQCYESKKRPKIY